MWSKLKQKISDELSARVTKIVNELETRNNTSEIEKTLIEINKKISTQISEVNDNCTAEINKIKNEIYSVTTKVKSEVNNKIADEHGIKITNELNARLTAEIKKINPRDAGYASEVQKIFNMTTRINSIEEACRNEFGKISSEFNASIESLRNEMIQCYAIAQRLQVEFDQLNISSDSSNSSLEENRNRFKRVFDSKKEEETLWIMRLKL
jgi:SMC interacting uncharacterized protein involved in chromosome segregation